jgi:hypothetical protein
MKTRHPFSIPNGRKEFLQSRAGAAVSFIAFVAELGGVSMGKSMGLG